jgi:ABC-type Fe3+/spermidine/putrescine transport system ATPase subunit
LSALDKNLREQMKAELKMLHRQTGVTVIYVTHDQSEALALSDRIVVMREGRILDVDYPDRLYSLPSSSYLATFIGDANLIGGTILSQSLDGLHVRCSLGPIILPLPQVRMTGDLKAGDPVNLVIRPENIVVQPPEGLMGMIRIKCVIEEMLYNGSHTIYTLSGTDVPVSLTARCGLHRIGAFSPGAVADIGLWLERSVVVRNDKEGPEQ